MSLEKHVVQDGNRRVGLRSNFRTFKKSPIRFDSLGALQTCKCAKSSRICRAIKSLYTFPRLHVDKARLPLYQRILIKMAITPTNYATKADQRTPEQADDISYEATIAFTSRSQKKLNTTVPLYSLSAKRLLPFLEENRTKRIAFIDARLEGML